MITREVVDLYYSCVNHGAWDEWLTLFSDDVVGDEQLAGHFAGVDALRGAIAAIRNGYRIFLMHPKHIITDGDTACVI